MSDAPSSARARRALSDSSSGKRSWAPGMSPGERGMVSMRVSAEPSGPISPVVMSPVLRGRSFFTPPVMVPTARSVPL